MKNNRLPAFVVTRHPLGIFSCANFLWISLTFFSNTHFLQAESSESIAARLEQARENVTIALEAERRIQEKIDILSCAENVDSKTPEDYKSYLERLQAITQEHQEVLLQMETLYSNYVAKTGIAQTNKQVTLDWELPAENEYEKSELELLDKEFQASLAEFDTFLLHEENKLKGNLDRIARVSSERVKILNKEAEKAAEKIQPTEKEKIKTERDANTDDVVAKQLREAAEAETDPELKRLLWDEYDRYKEGLSGE